MKSQPLLNITTQPHLPTLTDSDYSSFSLPFNKNSTFSSEHSNQEPGPASTRTENKHKINNKAPLFSFKKHNQEYNQNSSNQHFKTEYSIKSQQQKTPQSHQSNSQKQSQTKHQLPPSQLAHRTPEISEFISDKKIKESPHSQLTQNAQSISNILSASSINRREIPAFSSEKITTFKQEGQSLTQKCSQPLNLDITSLPKCHKHEQVNVFTEQMTSKMKFLLTKMISLQNENINLKTQLQNVHKSNQQKSKILQKQLQEYNQLLSTKNKWTQGKTNLEYLQKEVTLKMLSQKSTQKQNMNKADCQLYFKQKSKQKIKSKGQQQRNDKKSHLLQKLNIKVQKN